MKLKGLFLLLVVLFVGQAHAQKQQADFSEIKVLEDTLGVLSYAIVNAQNAEQRFMACRRFIPMLTQALKTPNSFQYKFQKLKHISFQYPQDSSFRIMTWQLYVDTSEYRYYGAIQMNSEDLKLFPLIDRSFELPDFELEQAILPNDKWYGALYYNIRDFKTREGNKYLLFGFDGYSFRAKRKLIDVLSFRNGQPIFGAPVFVKEQSPVGKHRLVLQYGVESSVRCNYDDFEELIIFDHLISIGGEIPGQGAINVPDGSFEAYQLKKGLWVHVDKVFNTMVDEPPREHPVLDERKSDIFGKNRLKKSTSVPDGGGQ